MSFPPAAPPSRTPPPPPPSHLPQPSGAGTTKPERHPSDVLDWTIDVPLVTEPLLWSAYLRVAVLSAVIMGALMSFLAIVSDNTEAIIPMLELTGIALVVVMGVGLIVTAVVMGNRMSMRFVVDDRGIEQHTIDRRARAAASAAVVLGALAGRPGATGAGLLARSNADRSAAWAGIGSARYHPGRHAISLQNSWRTVMILFCGPVLYDAVAARVAAELAASRGTARAQRNPLPGLLIRTFIAVVAGLPFFALPYPFELDLFVPLLTLCFAIAAVWLVPHLGLAAIAGLGWMWIEILARGALEIEPSRIDKWGPLMVTAITTAVLVLVLVALVLGWFSSGLAGDEAELKPDERGNIDEG